MAAKYELKVNKKQQYSFNLKAGNGEIILTSETYQSRDGALTGIQSVQSNGGDDSGFIIKKAKNGELYFVLMAKNNQVIGRSEMYKTEAGARRGIASVRRNAGAKVSDLTLAK